jgi:hypothetical protein
MKDETFTRSIYIAFCVRHHLSDWTYGLWQRVWIKSEKWKEREVIANRRRVNKKIILKGKDNSALLLWEMLKARKMLRKISLSYISSCTQDMLHNFQILMQIKMWDWLRISSLPGCTDFCPPRLALNPIGWGYWFVHPTWSQLWEAPWRHLVRPVNEQSE